MKRAYKTELDPNNKQRTFFRRCSGVARFVYNWGLVEWERRMESKEPKSAYRLALAFNAIKRDEFPFVTEVPYAVSESAFRNLESAFQRYWKEKKDGTVEARRVSLKKAGKWERRLAKLLKKGRKGIQLDPGYSQFKSRYGTRKSFQLRKVKVEHDRVRLTGIGWVRLKERSYIPTDNVKYGSYATISECAGHWYISIQVEEPDLEPVDGNGVIGVDVGIKSLAACSDGTVFENPKALYKYERKLKRLQKELSRRQRGGQNWCKTKAKIARVHQQIANARKYALHQVSHHVTIDARPEIVVIEDLNIKGMLTNHRLAQAISDASMYELHRQIGYKAEWFGIEIVKADRWYASSKTCSGCGCIQSELTLSDRIFKCPNCGLVIDRDLNSARNLAALGIEPPNGRGLPGELEGNETLL